MFSHTFWEILFIGEMLVVLQGILAWLDGMFTPAQMRDICGYKKGLPFLAHGGMWGDVFIISPLAAAIVGRYGATWSSSSVAFALLIGLVASDFMHSTYRGAPYPEAHVKFQKLTIAGYVHFVYMTGAFAVLLLLYFGTEPAPAYEFLMFVSVLLVIHVAIGTHVVLGLMKPSWYAGDPLHSAGTWIPILATALLTFGRSAYLAF